MRDLPWIPGTLAAMRLRAYNPSRPANSPRGLNLCIRREGCYLDQRNPATGRHIATFEGERARADREREARLRAEELAENEREARTAEQRRAEARTRELEEENRRLRGG